MENENNYFRVKNILLVGVIILVAIAAGFYLGRNNDDTDSQITTADTTQTESNDTASKEVSGEDVKKVVSYNLPDGWDEARCPDSGAVYIVPSGANDVDCDASPSAPVKISIDAGNNTDCNQLQNVQNVSKHVCVTEYINDMLSLKAQTVYNEQSPFGRKVAVDAYYINTGGDVVLVEYARDDGDNQYLTGWEQLAKSVSKS